MSSQAIKALLKEHIGLDSSSIGDSAIGRAVSSRITQTEHDSVESYYEELQLLEGEMRALIEEIVIPETWFFRDYTPFQTLKKYVLKEWFSGHKNEALNILSIPCSTGEEPYSIAMILDDSGFDTRKLCIDAVDLSQVSINTAKKGVYGENSFRGDEGDYGRKYFSPAGRGFQLDQKICQMVNFIRGNAFDEGLLPEDKRYDIIFCRNMLIYFDRKDQRVVLKRLHSMLKDDGVLFVGHAEASQILNGLFITKGVKGAFAFTKDQGESQQDNDKDNIKIKLASQKDTSQTTTKKKVSTTENVRPFSNVVLNHKPQQVVKQRIDEPAVLSKIREMADRGQLQDAEKLCLSYLNEHDDSVEAYYLLSMLKDAVGNHLEAIGCLKKVIYLNPDHYEALFHLAIHAKRNGDENAAKTYQKRAIKAEERSK